MLDQDAIWTNVLADLKNVLSEANFTTWFRETKIVSINGNEVIIGVPHTFAQEWIQQKFHKDVLECLKEYHPETSSIDYKIVTTLIDDKKTQEPEEPRISALKIKKGFEKPVFEPKTNQPLSHQALGRNSSRYETPINRNYTFESFIVGSSNRLAYAAAKAIAKKPGESIRNPLYFYGGVGLGKTHLLHAIGNEIMRQNPGKKVVYAPCEKYVDEYIQSLQKGQIDNFKDYYRNADILLIDDIQFLSKKEETQQEFFHTFNFMYQHNRQIVMTSDSRPDMIPKIAARLSSRFNGGMVADFQTPDFETRQAILQQKCEEKNLVLSNDLITNIAEVVQSNIRELEGVLNTIIAHCDLYGVEPSEKLINTILKQTAVPQKNIHVNSDEILSRVAEHFSIDKNDIKGKKRNKEVSYARQVAMFLLREETGYSHPKIGEVLGGRDHTTVMHGVNKIKEMKDMDELLQRDLSVIKEKLYSFN